jgi:hypothetical protein
MSDYTFHNDDLQKQICELLGLRWEGMRHLIVKCSIGGHVEVDAQFYVAKKKDQTHEPF